IRQRISSEDLISDWTYPMDDSAIAIANRTYKSVPGRIPGELNVADGGNNWISLSWSKPEPLNSAPVVAYKVESWQLGKEGGARWTELGITPLNSFDVFNLKQGEEYHFRVTPRNRYGWGESLKTNNPVGTGLAGNRPDFVSILPGQLKVLVGETANLNCCVKGKPIPEVIWMKNGHELEDDSDHISMKFDGYNSNLTIKNVSIEDEARYSCEASNAHGRASTYARIAVVTDRLIWEADARLKRERSADVDSEHPPQFTMRLRDRRVQTTYPVRLTCQVIGKPAPSITWFKNGEELKSDERHSMSRDEHFHTLEIAPTILEDGGTYEVMARNSHGAVSCRCSLVVDKGIRAYVAPEFCCGLEPLYKLAEGEIPDIVA
ncbi:Muscle M-line assembly protein unc-89, partial [Eumeta japonica]